MIDILKDIFLINAYWFSLPLIGFAILHLASKIKITPYPIKVAATLALKQHAIILFLISFTVTVFICSVLSFIFYLFQAPVKLLALMYLGALVLSCVYILILSAQHLWSKRDIDLLQLKNHTLLTKILMAVMILALIVDFALALYLKSYIEGDAIYHTSRVVDILSVGFNVQTSFFSSLKDGAYHYNVIYALYSVPAKIFHLEPTRVWEYSFGFFRLLQWVAVFTLGMYVFRNWIKVKASVLLPLAILCVLSAMAFFSSQFFIATYPNKIVNIWLILFVISLMAFEKNRAVGIAILGLSFLITTTHTSFGFIATCFIGLLVLTRLVIEKKEFLKDKKTLLLYAATTVILMIGPLITKLTPNRLNNEQLLIGDPVLIDVLGLSMKNPLEAVPSIYLHWVLLLAGLISTIYILVKLWKRKSDWAIAFSFLLFFPLVAYFPLIFTPLNHFVPVWLINTFYMMNIMMYVFIPISLWAIYAFIGYILQKRKVIFNVNRHAKLLSLIFLCIVMVISIFGALQSYNLLVKDVHIKDGYYTRIDQAIIDFKPILNNQKVIVASSGVSYYLAAMFPIDVVAVEIGHSPMPADATNRISCQEYLMNNLSYADLRTVKASYVVIPAYDEFIQGRNLALSKPYLKLVKTNQEFHVYEFVQNEMFDKTQDSKKYESCIRYQKTEK